MWPNGADGGGGQAQDPPIWVLMWRDPGLGEAEGTPPPNPKGIFQPCFLRAMPFVKPRARRGWRGGGSLGGLFLGGRGPGIGDSAVSPAKCPGRKDSGDVLRLCPSNLQKNRMLKSQGASRLRRGPPVSLRSPAVALVAGPASYPIPVAVPRAL